MTHPARRLPALVVSAVMAAFLPVAVLAQAQPPQKPPPPVPSLTGKWAMALELTMGTSTPALELVQDGEKLKGSYAGRYGKFPLTGIVKGRAVEFTVVINADGQDSEMQFAGEIAADGASMKGEAVLQGMGDATWSAKRAK